MRARVGVRARSCNSERRFRRAALDAANGTIADGTYNLSLAAVPNGSDTLLFAGTQDIFRCGLATGCAWRNTTNTDDVRFR